jgi:14-3-3 protein epsilon
MKGDYNRYLCEFSTEDNLEKYTTEAHTYYQNASELSDSNLRPKDTLRLGVALNYSVFNYEILNDANGAFSIAKKAFDQCLEDLSINNKDEDYKDATTILQLLDENMNMWSLENQEQAEKA